MLYLVLTAIKFNLVCYIMQILTSVFSYGCRIQITVSLSRGANTEWPEQNVFPLYVLLATPTTNISLEGVSLPSLVPCNILYQMISYLIKGIMFCSILRYTDSVGLVCLRLIMNLVMKITPKLYSQFQTSRI